MEFNPIFSDIEIHKSQYAGSLAYGRIQIGGCFWIDFTLKPGKSAQPWVSLPNKKKDDGSYYNFVSPVVIPDQGVDLKKDLNEFVVSHYNQLSGTSSSNEVPF